MQYILLLTYHKSPEKHHIVLVEAIGNRGVIFVFPIDYSATVQLLKVRYFQKTHQIIFLPFWQTFILKFGDF